MKYFTLLAAFLPITLATPIGYNFRVNLITSISNLAMTTPSGTTITHDFPLDTHEHETETLNVVGFMIFTETGVPQTYKVEFGMNTYDIRLEFIDTAGLKEADAAIQYIDVGNTTVQFGWATKIPPNFLVPIDLTPRIL